MLPGCFLLLLLVHSRKHPGSTHFILHRAKKNGYSNHLSSRFSVTQGQRKVVKIKNLNFSYWAWSTPWGQILSLKSFCRNPVLSWAIRYSVFQPVKFCNSFKSVCGNLFSTFWHLMVRFGYNKWFFLFVITFLNM